MYKKLLLTFLLVGMSASTITYAEPKEVAEIKAVPEVKETKGTKEASAEKTTPEATVTKKETEKKATPETTETKKAPLDNKAFIELMEKTFGSAPDAVSDTPIMGMKEVSYGMEVLYISGDGQYFFQGDLYNLEHRENISDKKRSTSRKKLLDAYEDKNKVISFKAKDEKYALAVFTDIDCPYCAKFHQEVAELNKNGVTINYYMFPRAGEGSDSFKKAVSVWCNADQQKAMSQAKKREDVPAKECDNPIIGQYKFGQKIGVTGTPALVTTTGKLIPGYMPAKRLIKMLETTNKAK